MKTYLVNPTIWGGDKFIREGRCMQKASSWVANWPPITLATLGAIAKKRGEVRLVDGNVEKLTLDGLLEEIKAFKPDIVVVNTGFPSIDGDMAVAGRMKESLPGTKIIAFGVYFTLLGEEGAKNYPFIDIAIIGEPERTFEEIIVAIDEKREDYSGIKGIAYRDPAGIRVTEERPLIEDLDSLPLPDRTLLKNKRYVLPHNGKAFTLINAARGCPYRCIYCIVAPYYGRKMRRHSVDYITSEIKECLDRYGIKEFLLWEEIFTLDREYVLELCAAIQKKMLPMRWAATTRVDRIDREMLGAMKKAGCYLLGLGIESGDQAILDSAKKGQTLDGVRRAVRLCNEAGIKTMGHFIFGLPGETRRTAENTIKFMLSLGLDYVQCYCAVPYPKTELGLTAQRNGWISAGAWSEYDFGGESILRTETMRAEEVSYFRGKAFRSFYFRPRYIAKAIKEIGLLRFFKMLGFLKWMKF